MTIISDVKQGSTFNVLMDSQSRVDSIRILRTGFAAKSFRPLELLQDGKHSFETKKDAQIAMRNAFSFNSYREGFGSNCKVD